MKKNIIILSLLFSLTLSAQEYKQWIYSDSAAEVKRYEVEDVIKIISYQLSKGLIQFDFNLMNGFKYEYIFSLDPLLGYDSSLFQKTDKVQLKSEYFSWDTSLFIYDSKIHIRLTDKIIRDIALNSLFQIRICRDGKEIKEWNFKYPESLCISNCAFLLWKEIQENYFFPKAGELTVEQDVEKKRIQLREFEIKHNYPKLP